MYCKCVIDTQHSHSCECLDSAVTRNRRLGLIVCSSSVSQMEKQGWEKGGQTAMERIPTETWWPRDTAKQQTSWAGDKQEDGTCACACDALPQLSLCRRETRGAACGDLWQPPGPKHWASCLCLRPPDHYRLHRGRQGGRESRQGA